MEEVGNPSIELETSPDTMEQVTLPSPELSATDFMSLFAPQEVTSSLPTDETQDATSPQEVEQSAEVQRQETEAKLISHYGGQLFQYGKYSGTVTEMINTCPGVQGIVDQGFDAFVEAVEPFKVDEITEPKSEDNKENLQNELSPPAPSTDEDENKAPPPPSKVETLKADEKVAVSIQAPAIVASVDAVVAATVTEKVNNRSNDDTPVSETKPEAPAQVSDREVPAVAEVEASYTQAEAKVEAESVPEVVVEAEAATVESEAPSTESAGDSDTYVIPMSPSEQSELLVVPEMGIQQEQVVDEAGKPDVEGKVETPEEAPLEVEGQSFSEAIDEEPEAELPEPVIMHEALHLELEPELEIETALEPKLDVEADVEPAPALEPEAEIATAFDSEVTDDAIEAPSEEQEVTVDSFILEDDTTEAESILEESIIAENFEAEEVAEPETVVLETDEVEKYFEEWRGLAEQEAPVEVAFETIIMQLDAEATPDEAEDEALEQIEVIDEPVFNVEYETLSEETPSETLEMVLETEAHPELYVLLVATKSAKRSVEQLYTACTQEECQVYVEQLVQDLTIILRELGYENPEKIIRDFLRTHSPEALKLLIEELERALYQATVRNLSGRRLHASRRHVRVGKFVQHVMGLLAPKTGHSEGLIFARS